MQNNEDQIVYILTNEAMPDFIKIGKTNNILRRIQDLDWTNTPLPFQCYYASKVKDSNFVEHQIHSAFSENRVRSNREFFKMNPERVVAILKLVEIENVTPNRSLDAQPEVKEELEKIYTKKFNFKAFDIPIGSELRFIRDKNMKAKVVEGSNVLFKDEIKSVSKAAQEALGVSYGVQGPRYWMFEDETLDERRERLETEA